MNQDDYDYEILSKPIGAKQKEEAAARAKADEEHHKLMQTALEALA